MKPDHLAVLGERVATRLKQLGVEAARCRLVLMIEKHPQAGPVDDLSVPELAGRAALGSGRNLFVWSEGADAVDWVRLAALAGVSSVVILGGGEPTSGNDADVFLVKDHLNLTGDNPLIGPNVDAWGVRFPDMTEPYDVALREALRAVGPESVVADVPPPVSDSDMVEVRALGADVVAAGLSHAVIAARHMGMAVAACLMANRSVDSRALERVLAALPSATPD